MRITVVWLFFLGFASACSAPDPRADSLEVSRPRAIEASIADLQFNDEQLDAIATALIDTAKKRGIESSSGTNRIERLIALEAALDAPPAALHRVNYLVLQLTQTDRSEWARMRQKAERDFCARAEPEPVRVCDMLRRWHQYRTASVMSFLSSNYEHQWIPEMEWERRFHEFAAARPMDAGSWGWILLRERREMVEQQYDRADAESAYRFYLEFTGFGTGRDARNAFSVPGVAIAAAPEPPENRHAGRS